VLLLIRVTFCVISLSWYVFCILVVLVKLPVLAISTPVRKPNRCKGIVSTRVVFVGGSRGTSHSLDLTFPPTGLSENIGGMERGRGGKAEKGRVGRPPALLPPPPTGFCLRYQPGLHEANTEECL